MEVECAIFMAAICNFFGVLLMTLFHASVAMTIRNMVNFKGESGAAMIALEAAMAAIVIWAVGAWYFGIPTSESHALIAGLLSFFAGRWSERKQIYFLKMHKL